MTPWKNFVKNAGSFFCLWKIPFPQQRKLRPTSFAQDARSFIKRGSIAGNAVPY
jgi:hypothetical protein